MCRASPVVGRPLVALDHDLGADRRAPLAAEREPHPGLQVLGQVALVEPDGDARAGLVADRRLDDGQVPPPRRPQPDPLDRDDDGRLLAGPDLGQKPCRSGSPRAGTARARAGRRPWRPGRGRSAASASRERPARRSPAGRGARGSGPSGGRGKPSSGAGAPANARVIRSASTSMPSVPGPPWVPTTAPISHTRSMEASGRAAVHDLAQALQARRRRRRAPARPAPCARRGPPLRRNRSNSRIARRPPETRACRLDARRLGASAAAARRARRRPARDARPIRPPRRRYSSVST